MVREHGDGRRRRHLNWQSRGIGVKIGIIIAGICAAGGFFVLFGYVVVWLWNWLMPAIFNLPAIGFWQAWGLLVLSSILFKGHPSANQYRHDRRRKRALRERLHDFENNNRPEDGIAGADGVV